MAKPGFQFFLGICLTFMLSLSVSYGATDEERKVYIAYLGSLPEGKYFPASQHLSMIQEVVRKSSVEDYLVRSYRRSFNGFAAMLTDEEARKLASMEGVISVFPKRVYHLQTTRSWDFMGLSKTVKHNDAVESDVVVGVIDTGVWPESKSFSGKGFGPPPKKWKGGCEETHKEYKTERTIARARVYSKLIGARVYSTESARDTDGHGSHTASTAAGINVNGASFFGLAKGTARGGVPLARIAVYKVCDDNGCGSAEILAAFDDAIADEVDVITISIGNVLPIEFYNDPIAIGSFHANVKGILTMQSAGNEGDLTQTVTSVAPWLFSVAASTTDRLFIDKVVLGNGKTLNGFSINSFRLNGTKFPLAYGKEVAVSGCGEDMARICMSNCLDPKLVKDKIVVCDDFDGSFAAYYTGALGSITPVTVGVDNVSFVAPFPLSTLSFDLFVSLQSYINSTKKPKAEILKSETIKDSYAPLVALFSSRGPNYIVPDILKPDISAPGVDILAAYSPLASPSEELTDKRIVDYNIMSGTSMSSPHVAGVAAYVKSFHPDWSPSAIKSAIMTTALAMRNNRDREFAYGSGHVNPIKAINPGLVYDADKGDYISFLCSIGYKNSTIRQISGDNSSCSKTQVNLLPRDLNYPSLTASIAAHKSFTVNFHRKVTNVGVANSTYKVSVSSNSKLVIKVSPQVLSFKSLKEKKSYNVTVTGKAFSGSSMASTVLVWSDGTHSVRSPIVIHTYKGTPRPASRGY